MIEKLCKDLKTSYNTNILDNESQIVQNEFLKVSRQNRNNTTNPGRKVLMELICNHYDKNIMKLKPIAQFIGGPKTLSIHWHPVYKKMIYIFGEWHANITDCEKFEKDANMILVEDYLYNLMLTTDVFLDIYFEFISYKNGQYPYEPYVDGRSNELFKKFRKCLQYNTRSDASCQLARVHYFDIRSNDLYEKNPIIDIVWTVKQIRSYTDKKDIEEACSSFKLLLTKYPKIITLLKELQKDIKTVCKFMEKQLEENQFIKKELDKIIENIELKMLILNFYKKLISEEVTKYYDFFQIITLELLDYEKISNDILFISMKSIRLVLLKIMSYFADVYLLARMFKNFDMSEMEKKAYKGSTDQPIHANNIIIYCGNLHAIKYREFLSSIGFNDIDHVGNLTEVISNQIPNTPKNCLDMRNIKQPLFSYSSEEKELIKTTLKPAKIAVSPNPPPLPQFKLLPPPPFKSPVHLPLLPEIDEVPKEPCPAIHATPQPPLCWDIKTRLQYHPDKNLGCPKTAGELFARYGNLNMPTKLKECEEQREKRERKQREREKRERGQREKEQLEKEEQQRKRKEQREKLKEQREKLEKEEQERVKREREKLQTLFESTPTY